MFSEMDNSLSICFVNTNNIYSPSMDAFNVISSCVEDAANSLAQGQVINYLKGSFKTGFYTTAKLLEDFARIDPSSNKPKWKQRCVKALAYPVGVISLLVGSVALPFILSTGISLAPIAGLILLIRKITDHTKTALKDYSIPEKLIIFPTLCLIKCILPTALSNRLSYE